MNSTDKVSEVGLKEYMAVGHWLGLRAQNKLHEVQSWGAKGRGCRVTDTKQWTVQQHLACNKGASRYRQRPEGSMTSPRFVAAGKGPDTAPSPHSQDRLMITEMRCYLTDGHGPKAAPTHIPGIKLICTSHPANSCRVPAKAHRQIPPVFSQPSGTQCAHRWALSANRTR